jgi:hypothetical protein
MNTKKGADEPPPEVEFESNLSAENQARELIT